MACINRLTLALSIAGFLFLTACGGMSKKEDAQQEVTTPATELDPEAPLVPIPNPYLAQDVKVPEEAKAIFKQAKVAMQSEDWQTAEQLLIQLTGAYPTLSGGFVNLGIVNQQLENIEEAESAFKYAIEQNPLNGDAYVQYGILLREEGRFDEAESQYLKAIEVWPHNLPAHINLGILYDLYMGKFEAALKHYQMAKRLSADEDQQLAGWIIDLQRRMAANANE